MLEHSPDGPPPLVAAPRHLRRRRMHTEIPDALLVPGVEPIPLQVPPPAEAADHAHVNVAQQDKESQQLAREMLYRRKRRVALLVVLVVAIAVPAIVLALLLG